MPEHRAFVNVELREKHILAVIVEGGRARH